MHDLTDSYCERCGVRYVFRDEPPKGPSLKSARVLAKGLKSFVLNDGQSMAEAMALARQDDERDNASRMTEAFHRTFNFCMTCRQYACDKCWNDEVGACLSCAPSAGHEATAPREHLIVRTPLAPRDAEWTGGVDLDALLRDSVPGQQTPLAPPEWPAKDLGTVPRTAPRSAARRSQAAQRPATPPAQRPATPPAQRPATPPAPRPAPEPAAPPAPQPATPPAWTLWDIDSPPQADGPAGTIPRHAPTPDAPEAPQAQLLADPTAEALAPRRLDSVADELIGALYEAAEPVPMPRPSVPLQPPAPPEPQRKPTDAPAHRERVPIIGRLLGRRGAPEEARAETHRRPPADGRPAESWPHPTPWGSHQVEHRELPAARPQDVVAEQLVTPQPETVAPAVGSDFDFAEMIGSPRATPPSVPAPEPEPMLPETPAAAARQRVFELESPPADRRPAPEPPEPAWTPPAAIPATSQPDRQPRFEEAPIARPMGATWPAVDMPAATWAGPPAHEVPSAAVLAAQQAAQLPSARSAATVWAASAQEVLNRGGGRACYRCALPVSTHARFCRRCGAQQI